MACRRKKRTALRHFIGWRFPLSGSFQGTHLHFSGSKSEIYQEMHPTLDDSRVSSTMRSFRPKYRKSPCKWIIEKTTFCYRISRSKTALPRLKFGARPRKIVPFFNRTFLSIHWGSVHFAAIRSPPACGSSRGD